MVDKSLGGSIKKKKSFLSREKINRQIIELKKITCTHKN